ncbi:bifunctional diaminohydroxyphosphoribosylaminopyrimidine deaminase/5-amino-6-(5-phosphoribosylamino)uracil reductase RibD [Curvibacter sp. CHRR-16]|uniref:bifunctional diaminohydroxyphosphoribosylaminopyrimidine deaminase/5-amino-6-(5-phosphoribosylamino)uracil reductase RibD n=1 Tax=Curvibacter sp. CHRR-16 TaxID=2835872 RepID=UPI001BDA9CA8|nr:bifunctional diaminohydroxyphosphoribosylaminopyrimidine deaminase/5-amino-6-(5-phosphoribosylamino)uracil reductase RibD [Curvibacter sp. CHRR-16]MBT0569280.1 bifunctional diaminohydroxyphosphoribosylaminopyrimidine deaminase/5-amino-6-(5-phosphoribosylamino)uracil reductase RibD [Curvibacter sp. CHRR-16]
MPAPPAHDLLAQAQQLAEQALYLTNPNPRVGCVIANAQGRILGQGHTQRVGGPHAEVMALRDAAERGNDVRGATAYVTLEPCAHQGRTGPCCVALAQAGIGKVVASLQDPNPKVAGQGFASLRAAGVEVSLLPPEHALARAAHELNIGFMQRMQYRKPWVRLKMATSLDGTTALHNGQSQWITSPEARQDGHHWRARACAILTGIGTVLADKPQLNVRGIDTPRQPHVVVLDSQLRTPADAPLFIAGRAVYISATGQSIAKNSAAASTLQARGAHLLEVPSSPHGQHPDLAALLPRLAQQEINELHVEAGPTLSAALLQAGLVDELLLYVAPTLLGPGRPLFELPALQSLSALPDWARWQWHSATPIGPDLRLLLRRA